MNNSVTPKVSVLVVTYNHEKYIRHALESMRMQQTDFEFEIVVADDHSHDSTIATIKEYQGGNHNIRILPSEQNVGITRNYRRGFAACRGEYIAVLEGDDYWISSSKLASTVAFLEQHPECAFCFHRYLLHEEPQNCFTLRPTLEIETEFAYFSADQLARDNFIGNFSTCVYRRELIERLDPALWDMTVYDWMLNIVLAQNGLIGYLPVVMSAYRIHPGGAWSGLKLSENLSWLMNLVDTYNEFLDFKLDSEFQIFKAVQRGEATRETLSPTVNPR